MNEISYGKSKLFHGPIAKCFGNLQCRLGSSSDLKILECTSELREVLGSDEEYFTKYLSKSALKKFYSKFVHNGSFSVSCMLIVGNGTGCIPVTLFCYDNGSCIYCIITIQEDWYSELQSYRRMSDKYDRLLENTETYLFETDLNLCITCCTSKLLDLFPILDVGGSLVDFLNSSEYVDPKNTEIIKKILNISEVFSFGISEKVRFRVEDSYRWFQVRLKSIVNPDTNKIDRIIGSLVDIDEFESSYSKLSAKLNKDSMTGCFLKSYLMSERIWTTVSDASYLMFFDLDKFKQINDTYGHIIGDDILKAVADIAKDLFAALPGLVCRFGGDEFCVYFPKISEGKLVKVVQEFINSIKQIEVDGTYPVTLSIGIKKYEKDLHFSMQDLVDSADAILYQAKNAGRDKVLFG